MYLLCLHRIVTLIREVEQLFSGRIYNGNFNSRRTNVDTNPQIVILIAHSAPNLEKKAGDIK